VNTPFFIVMLAAALGATAAPPSRVNSRAEQVSARTARIESRSPATSNESDTPGDAQLTERERVVGIRALCAAKRHAGEPASRGEKVYERNEQVFNSAVLNFMANTGEGADRASFVIISVAAEVAENPSVCAQ